MNIYSLAKNAGTILLASSALLSLLGPGPSALRLGLVVVVKLFAKSKSPATAPGFILIVSGAAGFKRGKQLQRNL